MSKNIIIILAISFPALSKCQEHGGVEQYYYTGAGTSSIVPKLYYQNAKNWFGEMRYNYEELQTLSLNAGKKIYPGLLPDFSITPLAGLVLGKINGGNVGANVDANYHNFFISSESQYTFSFTVKTKNFFYNWSEAGYQFQKFLYGGFAAQFTSPYQVKNYWQAGVMIGAIYKNWTFPVYAFNPATNRSNYVVGINWEWKYDNSKSLKK